MNPEKRIDVLGNGFVSLYGTYLTDQNIVEIARVSTGKGKKTEDEDKPFIDYLFRHEHASPFGFPQMTFKIKAPIFVARQLFRHRMAQVNEFSGRYSEMPEDTYLPEFDRIQAQGTDNRQGSGEPLDGLSAMDALKDLERGQVDARRQYESLLGLGVSKELARINLPLSQMTVFFWQQDLRNLLHMIKLRIDSHAQPEIQEYGRAMYEFAKEAFPWTVETFEKHAIDGERFHRDEMEIIRDIASSDTMKACIRRRVKGWRKSHRREFFKKLGLDNE